MALFTISDLHLSLSADKPMDIFYGWDNYVERIRANWTRVVSQSDTVIVPGDISWALKLSETVTDFRFIDALPGKKIFIKGNHDLWWSTMKKLRAFKDESRFDSIEFLFNSSIEAEGKGICGSRGWLFDRPEAEKKIILREAARLETSILSAVERELEPVVFLHYPPVYENSRCEEILDVLKKYGIKKVYHGHIHGSGLHRAVPQCDGIEFKLVSCDCCDFTPYRIMF